MYFKEFSGKKILVTGASRGIGKSIAVKLVLLGARVTALGMNPENLLKLKKEIPNIEDTICTNLENWDESREALEGKSFQYLINNAGINVVDNFMDVSPETFDRIIGINLKSVINVSQVIAKEMLKSQQHCSILNVSSVSSKIVMPGSCAYSVSKSGLDILTKYMAVELGKLSKGKIRVNSINPSGVMTDLMKKLINEFSEKEFPTINMDTWLERIPLGNIFVDSEQVANAALFLLSNSQAGNITGQNLFIDSGYSAT